MLNSRSRPTKDGSEPKSQKSRKPLIEYDQPDYNNISVVINVRVLQTDKRNKNVLTLGRNIIETLEWRAADDFFEDMYEERVSTNAVCVFNLLCHSISETYENVDEESIEGTNGIWQVSFLSECTVSCKCADATYHIM